VIPDKPTIHKISGPPGTGKSTTLLNVVQSLLSSGVDPEHIVYTTFTRAGAYEARDRACARFKLPPDRLPYFRTLHSLCYQLLPKTDVMSAGDWCVIAKTLGLHFSLSFTTEEGIPRGHTKGDYLLSLWSLGRVSLKTPAEVFNERESRISGFADMPFAEFEHFIATVAAYKEAHGKIDFTDMLERFLTSDVLIHADYIIIDEAQDLSALQWKVVEKLYFTANEAWIAGDDDQAIHEWNGASPTTFIELVGHEYSVLPQSYRIPSSVHGMAEGIIQKLRRRLPKTYQPRQEAGRVSRVPDLEEIDLSSGSWLLLARNLCFLEGYIGLCRRKGLLFTGAGVRAQDSKVLRAIDTWQRLVLNQQVTAQDAKCMYLFMSQRDRVKRGCKTLLQAVKDHSTITISDLVRDFGLIAPGSMGWDKALDMIPDEEREYLLAVQKNGGLTAAPRIEISTIHGAKGKEADHVVVRPDMTQRTYQSWIQSPDPEHRVFYVAVTRARQSLHLLAAQSEQAYPL